MIIKSWFKFTVLIVFLTGTTINLTVIASDSDNTATGTESTESDSDDSSSLSSEKIVGIVAGIVVFLYILYKFKNYFKNIKIESATADKFFKDFLRNNLQEMINSDFNEGMIQAKLRLFKEGLNKKFTTETSLHGDFEGMTGIELASAANKGKFEKLLDFITGKKLFEAWFNKYAKEYAQEIVSLKTLASNIASGDPKLTWKEVADKVNGVLEANKSELNAKLNELGLTKDQISKINIDNMRTIFTEFGDQFSGIISNIPATVSEANIVNVSTEAVTGSVIDKSLNTADSAVNAEVQTTAKASEANLRTQLETNLKNSTLTKAVIEGINITAPTSRETATQQLKENLPKINESVLNQTIQDQLNALKEQVTTENLNIKSYLLSSDGTVYAQTNEDEFLDAEGKPVDTEKEQELNKQLEDNKMSEIMG
jgi:hypothetical protein